MKEQHTTDTDKVSAEERYKDITQELKRAKKIYIAQTVLIVLVNISAMVLEDTFTWPAWISTILMIVSVIYVFLLFILYGLGCEYSFKGINDPEILELADRDGYYDMGGLIRGSPRSEGRLAYFNNVDINENPYKNKNRENEEKWKAGWKEASRRRITWLKKYGERKK